MHIKTKPLIIPQSFACFCLNITNINSLLSSAFIHLIEHKINVM